MDQIKTGRFIADERRALGLTQAQLAEKLHISEKTVSRWETGKGMPEVSLMMPLCRELGISVNELLSGERLSDDNKESSADRNLLSLLKEKAQRRKTLGVVITAIITLALMIGLYNMEFSVDASTTRSLETAIDEYSFRMHPYNESNVLETEAAGRYLFVLFGINGYDDGGIAQLERGIFGRYRFVNSNIIEWPLYCAIPGSRSAKTLMLVFGVNDLPGVRYFKFYSDSDRVGDPIYEGAAIRTPFLRVIETEKQVVVAPYAARYYDADGNEIDSRELKAQFKNIFPGSGTGTAELGLIYIFEGFILLLGIAFIRFFMGKTAKEREKAPEGAVNTEQEADNEIPDPGRADAGRHMRP